MDQALKIAIILGIMIVSLSIGYYLVLKPSEPKKTEFEACYNQCMNSAEDYTKGDCVYICGDRRDGS